jgi:hypothetical protein
MVQFLWFTKLMVFGNTVVASILKRLDQRRMLASSTIYQNLKSINVSTWYEILETQNICLLDKNYSEDKKYSEIQIRQISSIFAELYDDFFIRLNNRKAKANLLNSQDKMMLSVKLMVLQECLNTLIFISQNYSKIPKAYQKELNIYQTIQSVSKNTKFVENNTLSDNIQKVRDLINANQLSFDRKYSENVKEQNYTFEKQVVDVEQVLGRSLNIKECSVIQWIGYINKVQEIIKAKEKENGRS